MLRNINLNRIVRKCSTIKKINVNNDSFFLGDMHLLVITISCGIGAIYGGYKGTKEAYKEYSYYKSRYKFNKDNKQFYYVLTGLGYTTISMYICGLVGGIIGFFSPFAIPATIIGIPSYGLIKLDEYIKQKKNKKIL